MVPCPMVAIEAWSMNPTLSPGRPQVMPVLMPSMNLQTRWVLSLCATIFTLVP